MSSKTLWIWNESYKNLFNKAKLLINDDVCMKLYGETQPLCLETDVSGIGLGASLLHARDGTKCSKDIVPAKSMLRPIESESKSLTSTERRYSNSEREALGILHGLERFCHHCFAREVSIITDHKPLVAIFK